MKNYFYIPAVAVAAAVLFASCTKEQSSLTIDSVQGSATVYGTAFYDEGAAELENGAIAESNMVAAAGQTVLVKVPNSAYANNAQGYQSYLTTVNDDGSFEITVPVGSTDASAQVSILPFKATYNKIINGEIVKMDSTLFTTQSPKNVNLSDYGGEFVTLNAENKSVQQVQYNQQIIIQGNVTAPAWVSNQTAYEGKYQGFVTELTVKVTVKENNNVINTFTYNCTSDNTGKYEQMIVLPDDFLSNSSMTADITVSSPAYQADFFHYYEITSSSQDGGTSTSWMQQKILLYYWSSSASETLDDSNKSNYQNLPLILTDIEIDTDPVNRDEVYGLGNSIDSSNPNFRIEYNNPFNW